VSEWKVLLHKRAIKDAERIRQAGLEPQVKALIQLLRENPFQNPPQYEKLTGDLQGYYSRRINIQHRLVYTVENETKTVRIQSLWTHYER
jgi:Txe/YoeB family toxin of toxin-antitoxin system